MSVVSGHLLVAQSLDRASGVLLHHQHFSRFSTGSLHTRHTDSEVIPEQHRKLRHGKSSGSSSGSKAGACRRWFNDLMNEATRRHWEQVADRCFDRAYRAVILKVTPKPANGQVLGPRAKS